MPTIDEAVIITGHYAMSRRRASIHEIGDALWRRGFTVSFITVGTSILSRLRGDLRLQQIGDDQFGRIVDAGPRRRSFVWKTPWHPANVRLALANALLHPIFARYGELDLGAAETLIRNAALVIIESGAGILLGRRVRRLNPSCRLVYRVSDDVRVLKCHPVIPEAEHRWAGLFDLISMASPALSTPLPSHRNRVFHAHGFNPSPLAAAHQSPYSLEPRTRAVSVGTMLFDETFITSARQARPDIEFHVIGKTSLRPAANLRIHGEMRYEDMLPYVKFADIGLAPYRLRRGMDYLAHTSNKMMIYTAARLPIVAPRMLVGGGEHIFGYDLAEPQSIATALDNAAVYDRARIKLEGRSDWDDFLGRLLADAGYPPQTGEGPSVHARDRETAPARRRSA